MSGQAGKLNLFINQHATFVCQLTWKAANNGSPFNVSGYQALMQVRQSTDGNSIFEASTTNGMIEMGETNGRIIIRISAENTGSMKFRSGEYDLIVRSPNGRVTRIVEGTIQVRPGISKFEG